MKQSFILLLMVAAGMLGACQKSTTEQPGTDSAGKAAPVGKTEATTKTATAVTETTAPIAPANNGMVQAGNYTILDTRTDLTDRARAKQNVEDTLIKYPEVGCLVGLWSYNTPAIISAVKDARKQGQVKIVGFDEEEDTLQGVADGLITATVVQQPYEFGYQSMRILAALGRKDKSVVPANGIYDVPVKALHQADIAAFREQLKKYLAGEVAMTTGTQAAPAGDKVQVAFVTNNTSDFWKIARAGVKKGEQDFNVACEFQMPQDGTAAEQSRIVEALMAKGTSGMAISPNDPVNQIDMINRACAKMNVICHDSDAPKSQRIAYVGTNNYKAGREAGKLIKEALPGGGKLMLFVGRIDAQNAKDRRDGIIDELKGAPERP